MESFRVAPGYLSFVSALDLNIYKNKKKEKDSVGNTVSHFSPSSKSRIHDFRKQYQPLSPQVEKSVIYKDSSSPMSFNAFSLAKTQKTSEKFTQTRSPHLSCAEELKISQRNLASDIRNLRSDLKDLRQSIQDIQIFYHGVISNKNCGKSDQDFEELKIYSKTHQKSFLEDSGMQRTLKRVKKSFG